MSFRVEITCDARGCVERRVLVVDEAYALETSETVAHLVGLGWKLTKGQRASTARTSHLRVTCPQHTGSKR